MKNTAKKTLSAVTDRAIGNSNSTENQTIATLPKKILSLDEASAYLGIAKGTMYKYLGDGSIKGFKYKGSRVWKFDIEYLDQWLKQQQGGDNV
jgi:excisionase family DNA binding protein